VRYFFDRNIAIGLTRVLVNIYHEFSGRIFHLDEDSRFQPESTDVFIVQVLSRDQPKPVFLTGDMNMGKRPDERKALADSGLTVVFFRRTFHNLPMPQQGKKIIDAWPLIVAATRGLTAPTAFEVSVNGKINRLRLTRDL
jgi:hypothetical protein